MQNLSIKKIAKSVATIGILMFVGAMVFQIGVAFGWTNPLGNPPTGTGAVGVTSGGQVFVGPGGTTASGTAVLTVNGAISANKIVDLPAPIAGDEAANKAYVDAAGGGSGGGSLVIYYKQLGGAPPAPTCPIGWTQTMTGYGPHYIAIVAYDWLQGGTGGTGGGFGGMAPSPDPPGPPPSFGDAGPGIPGSQSYTTNAVAIGSDSVCSRSQQSVVPAFQFYQNASSGNFHIYSDACTGTGASQECNRCIVCHK